MSDIVITIDTIQLKRATIAGARPATLLEGEQFVNLAENLRLVGRQGVAVADLVEGRDNPDVILRRSLGEVLPGRVCMDAGGVFARVADPTNPANIGRVLGVIEGNGQLDTDLIIRTYGPLRGPFDFGGPGLLSIGDNGELTLAVRTYGFSQVVGYTMTGTDAFVSLGTPHAILDGNNIGVVLMPIGQAAYMVPDSDYQIPNDATQLSFRDMSGIHTLKLPSWDRYMTALDMVIIDEYGVLTSTNYAVIVPFDSGTRIVGTSDDRLTMSYTGAALRLRRCFERRAWIVC